MLPEKVKTVSLIEEEEAIFKPCEYLQVIHKFDDEIIAIEIPLFTNTELRFSNRELERVKNQLKVQLDWLENHGILNESNYDKVYSLCLIFLNLFSTCNTDGNPNKEKCFEIFVSIGILLSMADGSKEEQDKKLEEMREHSAYYTSAIIGFIEDVVGGEYNGVEDLPEEALNFYPELGKVIKNVQIRIDELKAIEPNYMKTYKYLFDENFKVVQATFIMLLSQKKDLPKGLTPELQNYINGGSYFLEFGLAFLETPIDQKIRNHVYFSRYKTLLLEICSKLNLLCGIGGDYDSDFGILENPLLHKWKNHLSLETLVKAEEKFLKELLLEFHELGEAFMKFYPHNTDAENLVDFGKQCYNSTLRGYYLSGIYTERKRKIKDTRTTMIQHWKEDILQQPQSFIEEGNILPCPIAPQPIKLI